MNELNGSCSLQKQYMGRAIRKIKNYSADINGETASVEDISGNNVLF